MESPPPRGPGPVVLATDVASLSVTIADAATPVTNITTLAAGRTDSLNRSMDQSIA